MLGIGRKVKKDFVYSSSANKKFLTVKELQSIIKKELSKS